MPPIISETPMNEKILKFSSSRYTPTNCVPTIIVPAAKGKAKDRGNHRSTTSHRKKPET